MGFPFKNMPKTPISDNNVRLGPLARLQLKPVETINIDDSNHVGEVNRECFCR